MKVLLIFVISIGMACSKKYHIEPILRQENVHASNGQYKFGFDSSNQNIEQFRGSDGIVRGSFSFLDDKGEVQYMEYTAGPDGYHVYRENLPVAVASVTETPEVQAARKAHEEAYNYLLSTTSSQRIIPSSMRNNKLPQSITDTFTTTRSFPQLVDSSTISPYVQSYQSSNPNYPLKNRYDTIEVVRKPIVQTESPAYTLSYESNKKIENNNFISSRKYIEDVNTPVQPNVPQVTAESHLAALRKAIAAQLVSYKNVPSQDTGHGVSIDDQEYQSGYRTELYSPVKVAHYSSKPTTKNIQSETEQNRKLAIIAAERALMKLLNAN